MDTCMLCLSHRTSSHMQDNCKDAFKNPMAYKNGAKMYASPSLFQDPERGTLVNHRKSCMRELLYESSTSTMGIWSSAVTSKLSLW